MVVKVAYAAITALLLEEYVIHIFISIAVIFIVHRFAQGRKTDRERDLHARTILITGGFTPFSLVLLQSLAQRGAHIIALSSESITSSRVSVIIDLLRSTTSNEQIFAEECDVTDPTSIRDFCARFLTGDDQRLDVLVFAHEYRSIGTLFRKPDQQSEEERKNANLATFLFITLLLPALLVAPAERDIRIVNVVNPFYAAAVHSFLPVERSEVSQLPSSIFLAEGRRSLRMVIITRHLQRVLDALPSGSAQVPKANESANAVPIVSGKAQRSNIVAVSASPGISRSDTIAPLFRAYLQPENRSLTMFSLYILLHPFFWILARSSASAMQSILHALFLPTPFKIALVRSPQSMAKSEEVLKPGSLYQECAVVKLQIPKPLKVEALDENVRDQAKMPADDGELGGELSGRLVWEYFEQELRRWEKLHPPRQGSEKAKDE